MRAARSAVVLALALAGPARAYDEDTHFWITYLAAAAAGHPRERAEELAGANVSLDRDADTTCFVGEPAGEWFERAERWHAMRHGVARDVAEKEGAVDARLLELMGDLRAHPDEPSRAGVALHYAFDYFAHQRNGRHLNRVKGHAPESAGALVGVGEEVDDVRRRPALARLVAAVVFAELWAAREGRSGPLQDVVQRLRARELGATERDHQALLDQLLADPRLPRERLRQVVGALDAFASEADPAARVRRLRAALEAMGLPPPRALVLYDLGRDGLARSHQRLPVPGTFLALAERTPRTGGPGPDVVEHGEELLDRLLLPGGTCPAADCGAPHATCDRASCVAYERALADAATRQDRARRGLPALRRYQADLERLDPAQRRRLDAAWGAYARALRRDLAAREAELARLHEQAQAARDAATLATLEARLMALTLEVGVLRERLVNHPAEGP